MDIEIKIDSALEKIKVLIFAPRITDEVKTIARVLEEKDHDLITGFKGEQVIILEPEKIIRIYSANQKIYAVCGETEYSLRLRLYQLESRLNTHNFIRISNSEIINLKKVESFDLSLAGTICVTFKNGTSSYVSRRYVSKIKSRLGI